MALFVFAALLLVAWAGLSLGRRNAPVSLLVGDPPDAALTFEVNSAARFLRRTRASDAALLAWLDSSANAFQRRGQALFWRVSGDKRARWIVFLPFSQSNRWRLEREKNALKRFGRFVPSGPVEQEGAAGYFVVQKEGLILYSEPGNLAPMFRKESITGDGLAALHSDSGYQPRALWDVVALAELEKLAIEKSARELVWSPAGEAGAEVSVKLTGADGVPAEWREPAAGEAP